MIQLYPADHTLNDSLFGSSFCWHRGDALNLHSATALTQIVRGLHRARAGERARAAMRESKRLQFGKGGK